MLFSVTELQTKQRCDRKHWLTSLNAHGWTPIWPSTALHLGTLVHRVGAAWLEDPKTKVPLGDIFYDMAADDLATLLRIHAAHNQHPTQIQTSDYWEMVVLGKAMCTNYQAFYKKPLPEGFKLVMPEQEVVVQIPNTEHCTCVEKYRYRPSDAFPSQPECECGQELEGCKCTDHHYLSGTLDAILLDPTDRLFVFERKTYNRRPNERHLKRTWQFLAYAYLLRSTQKNLPNIPGLSSATLGGIAYDGWWKRAAAPKGKVFSDLFYRTFMVKNPDEIDEFEMYLPNLAIKAAYNSTLTDPPERTIPPMDGCIDCIPFMDICDAISQNERPNYGNMMKRELTPVFRDFYKREEASV